MLKLNLPKITRLVGVALTAAMMASTAIHAQEVPDFLEGVTLSKPLNEVKIGFSIRGLLGGGDLYTAQYVNRVKELAEQYGVQLVSIDAQDDPAKQNQDVANLMAQGVDVVCVWATNAKAIVPALKKAHDAGFKVVTFNAVVDESGQEYIDAYVGPNDYNQSKLATQQLIDAMGGKGNIVMIRAQLGFSPSDLRAQAVFDLVAENPDIKLLDTQEGRWSQVLGQQIMENFITRFGNDIDGVVGADGYTSTGAYLAVDAARQSGKLDPDHVIYFADANVVSTSYDLMAEGKFPGGSVIQDPAAEGALAFETALKVALGIEVEKETFLPTPEINQDNYSQYPRPSN